MAYNRAEEDRTFWPEDLSRSQRELAIAAIKNEMSKQNQKRYERLFPELLDKNRQDTRNRESVKTLSEEDQQ